jgi:signal transduction histidine kinase
MSRNDLRLRITLVTLSVSFALLLLFGSSAWMVSRQLQTNTNEIEDAYRRVFRANLTASGRLDEDFVHLRAHQVREEVTAYLTRRYGSLGAVPPPRVLQDDLEFQKVALQWVSTNPPPGRAVREAADLHLGYTVVYARDFTMTTHVQQRLIGQNVEALSHQADLYLFWWDIFGRSVLEDTEKAGYYLWPEADDSVSIKYMVCTPIPQTPLMVAATFYPEFANKDVIVASARSVAKTLFEIDRSAKIHAGIILGGALAIVAVAVLAILLITGREAKRVSRDRGRLEKYWRLARIDHLVRSFSHAIRNDLFVIRNRVSVLDRGLRPTIDEMELARCRKALAKILQRADRIQHQVDRAVSDKSNQPLKEVFDAADVVRTIVARELEADGGEQFAVEIRDESGEARMEGIEAEFTVAVENLVLNARQATKGFGRLQIEIANRTVDGVAGIALRFRDTGPGFERPEKAAELGWTTRSDAGGTGTGLAIVERVVLQHQGYLSVRNATDPGWGAEVEIVLPTLAPTRLRDRVRQWVGRRSPHRSAMQRAPGRNAWQTVIR